MVRVIVRVRVWDMFRVRLEIGLGIGLAYG